jgi:hypothetical protein
MPATFTAALVSLMSVAQKHNSKYSFPTQERILQLIKDYHGITISRRTLCRILSHLETWNFFYRTKRHRKVNTPEGRVIYVRRSTMYRFKWRAFNFVKEVLKSGLRLFGHFGLPKGIKERPREWGTLCVLTRDFVRVQGIELRGEKKAGPTPAPLVAHLCAKLGT